MKPPASIAWENGPTGGVSSGEVIAVRRIWVSRGIRISAKHELREILMHGHAWSRAVHSLRWDAVLAAIDLHDPKSTRTSGASFSGVVALRGYNRPDSTSLWSRPRRCADQEVPRDVSRGPN